MLEIKYILHTCHRARNKIIVFTLVRFIDKTISLKKSCELAGIHVGVSFTFSLRSNKA